MALHAHGLSMAAPSGWDVRIYQRTPTEPGERTHPVMHAATFALPEIRGDYGSGAVELMRPRDIFLALLEFGPGAVDTPLFARTGRPAQLVPGQFAPGRLQRTIAGQSGSQMFFTEQARSFCLYIVLGSHAARSTLIPHAHAAMRSVTIAQLAWQPAGQPSNRPTGSP